MSGATAYSEERAASPGVLQQPVTVIIVNYNGREDLPDCLDSLRGQSCRAFQVLLLDNASTDGSVDFLRVHYPEVHLIPSDRNLGFCEANNRCLQKVLQSESDYAFLLNADTFLDSTCLEELLKTAERERNFGIFSPKVLQYPETDKIYYAGARIDLMRGIAVHTGMHRPDREILHAPGPTGPVCGCSMLIRKKTLQRIGLFDPAFFAYFEDTDLSLRAIAAGEGCYYVPRAVLYHKGGSDYTPHSLYYYLRNRFLFIRRHARWYHKLYFYPFILKNQIRAIRAYRKRGELLMAESCRRALWDGLCNRSGKRNEGGS